MPKTGSERFGLGVHNKARAPGRGTLGSGMVELCCFESEYTFASQKMLYCATFGEEII